MATKERYQNLVTYLAAICGLAFVLIFIRPISFSELTIGAVTAVFIAIGFYAIWTGQLALQGRRGPATSYEGRKARLIGILLVVGGFLSIWMAIVGQ